MQLKDNLNWWLKLIIYNYSAFWPPELKMEWKCLGERISVYISTWLLLSNCSIPPPQLIIGIEVMNVQSIYILEKHVLIDNSKRFGQYIQCVYNVYKMGTQSIQCV